MPILDDLSFDALRIAVDGLDLCERAAIHDTWEDIYIAMAFLSENARIRAFIQNEAKRLAEDSEKYIKEND